MLLEFETENYKSFKDRIKFSMIPAPKQKGLDYSIFHKKIEKKQYKALSSAVIYGPNASGKSNIIGAIQTLKNIILRGNIRNVSPINSMNPADYVLELIPNNTLEKKKNVFFSINFIQEEIDVKYSITLDIGMFLEKDAERKVVEENLEINEKTAFSRKNNEISFPKIKDFEEFLIPNFLKNFDTASSIAQNSLKSDDLFLMNGFRNIVSSNLADFIYDYFSNYLKTIYHSEFLNTVPIFNEKAISDKTMNEAVEEFGINSNKLIYVQENNKEQPILCSVMENKKIIPSQIFESYGTLRFVNIYPIIAEALKKGSTIIIDEFDASIHPSAIMSLINIFHNNEVNINHAQLIFNTHNPLYLNNNLFRRDEIKFVDRDDKTKCSKHYSLSDFGTKGTSARKGKDYMNNYFINEYGAIRDIDFTDIFKKNLEGK